jgi:hypothetical protein
LNDYHKQLDEWASDPDPALREKAQRAQQRLSAFASSVSDNKRIKKMLRSHDAQTEWSEIRTHE